MVVHLTAIGGGGGTQYANSSMRRCGLYPRAMAVSRKVSLWYSVHHTDGNSDAGRGNLEEGFFSPCPTQSTASGVNMHA